MNEIIFRDKRQNNFLKLNFFHLHKNKIMMVIMMVISIQVLNYQVSLTKRILGWRFSLNFMVILNARLSCIRTLGQRRSTVSTQTTNDAQTHLNQYVGTSMAQR